MSAGGKAGNNPERTRRAQSGKSRPKADWLLLGPLALHLQPVPGKGELNPRDMGRTGRERAGAERRVAPVERQLRRAGQGEAAPPVPALAARKDQAAETPR